MKDEDKTREELLTDLQRIRIDMAGMLEAEAFRRRAERELEQVTQVAAAIVRSSPCGLLILQRQFPDRLLLINANPQAAHLMGRALHDARGSDFEDVWPAAAEQGLTQGFLNALDTGEPFEDGNAPYKSDSAVQVLVVHAFRLPEDRLGVYLAEAPGHGMPQEIRTADREPVHIGEAISDDAALVVEEPSEERVKEAREEETLAGSDEDRVKRVEELSRQLAELSAQLLAAKEELAQETELRQAAEESTEAAAHELETRVKERTDELAATNRSLERSLAESHAQEEWLRTIQYELEDRLKTHETEIRELTETLEIEIEEHKKTEERLVTARVALESRMTEADEELESANELLREQLAERRRIETELRSSLAERELFIHEITTRLSEATECIDRQTAPRQQIEQSVSGESQASVPLQHSRLGYALFDTHGQMSAFNPRLLDIFGMPPGDDLQGFNLFDAPSMREAGLADLGKACLQSGEPFTYEGPFPDASGRHTIVRVHFAPIRQDHDEIIGCEAILEDVSADRIKQGQEIRSERLHALSRMTGSVADTFNDIVQFFSQSTQEALACVESASLSDMAPLLETMLAKTRDLGRTARRMRQFARMRPCIETGQGHVFDLSDVVKESIDMDALWSKPATIEGGCDVAVEPILTPGCHVLGIEEDFTEVMANLLENAVEALPSGGRISVRTSLELDEVVLEVRDDGAGIARNYMARLFEPFRTTKEGHNGLGLCVVFGIVRRHLGTLTVHSGESEGSTLTVRLPYCPKPADEEGHASEEPAQGNYRILLWYDFGPVARMIRNKLTRLGYSVFIAQSIEEGLEVLKRTTINAIVIDFSEEDVGLPDVLGAIRLQHVQTGLPKPPIIVLTASVDNGSLTKLLDCADLNRIVEKPVSVARLVDIVAEEVKGAESNYPKMSW